MARNRGSCPPGIRDAAFGRYSGKQTEEPALFPRLLDAFPPGGVGLFDRHGSSYVMLASLTLRQVGACGRLH